MTQHQSEPSVRASIRRKVANSRLLAAILLFVGAAVAAPVSVSWHDARNSQIVTRGAAEAERSDRGVLRTAFHVVRAVQPKGAGGGKDLLPVRLVDCAASISVADAPDSETAFLSRRFARTVQARAPPAAAA